MNDRNIDQTLRIIRSHLFKATITNSPTKKLNSLDRAYDMLTDFRRAVSRERSVIKQRIKREK